MLLDQEIPDAPPQPLSEGAREASQSIITQPGEVKPTKRFLHQVAVAALQGKRISVVEAHADECEVPLPMYVRPIVDGLEKVQRPEVAAAQIQALLAKPTRVTRTRRAGILACCILIPLVLILPFVVQTAKNASIPPDLVDLQTAVQWHSPVFDLLKPPDEETKALEIYLAATQRERINDSATWTHPHMAGLLPQQKQSAKEVVARMPPPTEEELKQAMTIVGPRLEGRRGDFESMKAELVLPIGFAACLAIYIAVPSVTCALLFRGGLLWWMFGITAVTRDGQLAGRWRLWARNLIAWSPLFIAPIALAMLLPVFEPLVPAVIFALAYLAATVASACADQRSWPDRLAGTWLVIR